MSLAETMTVAGPRPTLRIETGLDPARALGLAVSHLMTKPAFAKQPFGGWSRILVGQINRGHYVFALDQGRVVGFLGWGLAAEALATEWLERGRELTYKESLEGEAIVINAWSADTTDVTRALLNRLREIVQAKSNIYFKRFYKDGRVRRSRLPVNAFVAAHLKALDARKAS